MKTIKVILLISLIYICTCLLSGCWNYREIDELAIVSGVAVDRGKGGKVIATVEIVHVQQSQGQSEIKPVYVQAEGDTFFHAIRKIVALQGKKLYWSHAKVIIVSEDIAKEGISHVMDFAARDAEVREDMWILLSKETPASEILRTKSELENILAFELDDTLRAQRTVSKYPAVTLYEFIDKLESKDISTVIPTVANVETLGRKITYVAGAAIIKKDKLLSFLDTNEAKSLLWIEDELKGGLFIVKKAGETDTNVSLEIYKSKTKLKPEIEDGKLIMKVNLEVDVNIGEIMGPEDFISEKGRNTLEKDAEKQIKKNLESLIEKAQKELKCDFLGFGVKIRRSMPKVWKTIENQWLDIFADMDTSVEVDVRIRGSATTKKPITARE